MESIQFWEAPLPFVPPRRWPDGKSDCVKRGVLAGHPVSLSRSHGSHRNRARSPRYPRLHHGCQQPGRPQSDLHFNPDRGGNDVGGRLRGPVRPDRNDVCGKVQVIEHDSEGASCVSSRRATDTPATWPRRTDWQEQLRDNLLI